MARGSKVGGTKRRIKDAVGFLVIIALFLLYMIPFLMVLINSFKQKRDIIKNPFSLITEKGFTFDNYIKAFEKMQFVKAFGNSLFITGLSSCWRPWWRSILPAQKTRFPRCFLH